MFSPARPYSQKPLLVRVLLLVFALLAISLPGRATTVVPPEFDELVRQSDYVVRAKVTAVNSDWKERNGHRVIMTFVTLEILEEIAGDAPDKPVLEMLGGQIGTHKMILEGAPRFEVGDEDILFVRGNGRQVSPLTAMMHGRYRIVHDVAAQRSYVARENGEPLTDVAEVKHPLHREQPEHQGSAAAALPTKQPLSPTAFIDRIRAVKLAP